MSTADNKQRVAGMFEALRLGKPEAFWENLSDDVTWTVIGTNTWSGTYVGKQRVQRELMRPLTKVLGKDPRTTVQRVLADEDMVVVEARGDNVTRAGVRYDNSYCLLFRLSEGKVRAVVEYMDTELVTAALGERVVS